MPPRRQVGLGAIGQIRQELKEATAERKDVDQRIRRLRAAEAALYGHRSPNAKVLDRNQIKGYLAEHPGGAASRSPTRSARPRRASARSSAP